MIEVINRLTGKIEQEEVYGGKAINWLYGGSLIGSCFASLSAKLPFISAAYGKLMKQPSSKSKIAPFIRQFKVDESEFLPAEFSSFNDFFIRKLKPEARPIALSDFVCPADGRYRFFQNIRKSDGFYVKGQKFDLFELLRDSKLAEQYADGSMAIARLCPFDYHRFHFSHDAIPSKSELLNGYLYSVNPLALKKDITIFTQNKRKMTVCKSDMGDSLYIEVGATNVGSIVETYTPELPVKKGDEKGYFEFGASSLILLFEPDMISFDSDLIELSKGGHEIRCLMGQSMGNFSVR